MRNILTVLTICFVLISCKKEDTIPPSIRLKGNQHMQLDLYSEFIDPGVSAYDNEDGDISDRLIIKENIQTDVLGNYSVIYMITDQAGNTTVKTRVVEVIYRTDDSLIKNDTTPPVITLHGPNPLKWNKDTLYLEPGYVAVDEVYGNITGFVVIDNQVNVNIPGSYQIRYSVADYSGNTAQTERIVEVVEDHVAPVITILGPNPMNIPLQAPYYEEGATAYDDVWGDLTPHIQISGIVNSQQSGTYTITYTVEDLAGNIATAFRTVNVGF